MSRIQVLATPVVPVAERLRRIEAEPLHDNIAALLAAAAAECGEKLAWHFFESDEKASYREVFERVHALAHGLADLGVRQGSHVAVMLSNIAAFPTAWLALAVSGAVMVPVNISYRERELAYVVNDSEAEFIIIDASALPVLEAARASGSITLADDRIVVVGGDKVPYSAWDSCFPAERGEFRPLQPVTREDLVNIQYTSGTTGFPKGCMLTQGYWIVAGKVNAFRDGRRYERILASTPFFYMDPQWLLLMTFYQRGTLFVAARQSASRFISWVKRFEINFCLLPLLAYKQPPTENDRCDSIVRANMYGAPKELHAAIEARFDLNAREAFGMTELGPTLFLPIEAHDMVGSGSCGMQGPFRRCRIVNEAGETVGPGEHGELEVQGTGIFKGYYKRPEATEQAFRDGWFRTGDVFRRDERGFFYILGRTKDMIRRSSENIAAREVEAVLQGVETVAEAAVVPVPDEIRGEEVKAYIVLEDGKTGDARMIDAIIAHCSANLAPFKVPRFYEFRNALPKTASMKIAKHVLRSETTDMRAGSYDRVSGTWVKVS